MTEIRRKIAQRIRSCRIAAGWTVDETVRRLSLISSESISPSRYGNWEQQVRTPKIEQLAELAALFKKSAAWLSGMIDHDGTTGEGPLYYYPISADVPTPNGMIAVADNSLAYRLTFLDSLNLDSTCLLPFTATDRSMRGLIEEGDKVLIDRSITNALNRDDLFAILVGERIWIRWIRQDIEGQYKIQAEDRDKYPDDVVSAEKLKDLQILGRIKMISHIR